MGTKEIEIFHNEFEKQLLPFLSENGFSIKSKEIDESIGSYHLYLTKGYAKSIYISFCMHHYDLFDGIDILLIDNQTKKRLNELTVSNNRKVYSQLKPELSIPEIKNDLIEHCLDYIKN